MKRVGGLALKKGRNLITRKASYSYVDRTGGRLVTGPADKYQKLVPRLFHSGRWVYLVSGKSACRINLSNRASREAASLVRVTKRSAEYAMGRGKNGKGRNEAAMRIHDEWAGRFKRLRNGKK